MGKRAPLEGLNKKIDEMTTNLRYECVALMSRLEEIQIQKRLSKSVRWYEVTNMKSAPAWLETAKSNAEYTVRARCPQCGRKHITVFRLRHVSDSFYVQLGHFFRYAKHFDFQRLRWCTNSGQHPNWCR
jgi:hypothetical protein